MMPSLFRRFLPATLLTLGLSAFGAEPATNIVLRIRGEVAKPLELTLADLDALPHVKQAARDHDGEEASYEGVQLTELLQRAGVPMRENLRGPALRLGVLVKAADGYGALFSLAELDVDMVERWIFLADAKDEKPLPAGQGPLRVIVPGEKRHARWVRQVTELEVVRVGASATPAPAAADSAPGTITVAAAADLVFALDELNAKFQAAQPGTTVKVTTGASGNLFAQIRQGAPFDLFLSADMNFPRELAKAGAADERSLAPYAIGHLVLWTMKTNVPVQQGLAVLTNAAVGRLAIANPATAPYGRAAKAAMTNAGVWDVVQPKLVLGENIAQTAQFVQTGNVDAGLVSLSLVSAPKLKGVGVWWPVPDEAFPRLEQGAILTARGATNDLARAYLAFLGSDTARVVLDRFGFHRPSP